MILAAVECLRRLWIHDKPASRALALAIVLMSFSTALPYVRHAWALIIPDNGYQNRVEYKLTGWMAKNLPGARALATGTIRFWYDAWHDLPQLGGGSDQGMVNQLTRPAYWLITNGDVEGAVDWMRAFGVDAILVPDETSQEHYHDFPRPHNFAGVLPVLLDDREGDVIYRVPRRFPDLARVVETGTCSRAYAPWGRMAIGQQSAPTPRRWKTGPDLAGRHCWNGTGGRSMRMRLAPTWPPDDPSWFKSLTIRSVAGRVRRTSALHDSKATRSARC